MPPQNTEFEALKQELTAYKDREADLEHKLGVFQQIGIALSSSLNLDPLLDAIVEQVTLLLGAERCVLYILDRNSRELWCKLDGSGGQHEFRLGVGAGIAGTVAESGRGVNLKDARKDPRFDAGYEEATSFRTTSLVCVPLVDYRKRTIGVVEVLNKRDGYFSVRDQRLLEAVAAQAAMSIANSKMYLDAVGKRMEIQHAQERLRAKMDELDILYRIEQEMNRTDDLDTLLAQIVRHAVDTVPAQVGAIALNEGEQEVVTLFWDNEDAAQQVRIPAGEGILGQVGRQGRTVVVNEMELGSSLKGMVAKRLRREPRSVVCVPLTIKGVPIGSLAMYNKTGARSQFSGEDMKLVTLIASQVARAIRRAKERESELKANRLATVGQLLSGVLHDYKTPMSIISGYAQLMVAEEDEGERGEYSASIRKQIGMLGDMTGEILAFARGESNLLIRRVQLNKFIDDMSELLRGEFAGRGVELEVDALYLGPIRMDEVKFRRVVYNLARNAREAMPDGGTFTIGVREDNEKDEVAFTFQDSGQGVPEEIRHRLFASFVTSGKKDGTGLGLAIVKRIVDEHGGGISFESEPGRGTTFEIRMPRQGPSVEQRQNGVTNGADA